MGAQQKATELGLTGVHAHQRGGETIYMPGRNHAKLNEALRERGKEPTMVPGGDMSMGGSGDSDMSALDPEPAGDVFGDIDEVEMPEMDPMDNIDPDPIGPAMGDDDDDGEMEIY